MKTTLKNLPIITLTLIILLSGTQNSNLMKVKNIVTRGGQMMRTAGREIHLNQTARYMQPFIQQQMANQPTNVPLINQGYHVFENMNGNRAVHQELGKYSVEGQMKEILNRQ